MFLFFAVGELNNFIHTFPPYLGKQGFNYPFIIMRQYLFNFIYNLILFLPEITINLIYNNYELNPKKFNTINITYFCFSTLI